MKKCARVATIATIAFVVGMCSVATTISAAPAAVTNDTPTTHTVKPAGISISIPAGWVVYDPTRAESKAEFDAIVADNPDLEDFSQAAASGAEHSVLQAVSSSADGGRQASLMVQFYKGVFVAEPVSLLRAELEHTGVLSSVDVRRTRLAGVSAVRARCTMPLHGVGADGVQMVLYELVGRKGLVLVGAYWKDGAPKPADVDRMLQSVRLLQ